MSWFHLQTFAGDGKTVLLSQETSFQGINTGDAVAATANTTVTDASVLTAMAPVSVLLTTEEAPGVLPAVVDNGSGPFS